MVSLPTFTVCALLTESKAYTALASSLLSWTGAYILTVSTVFVTTYLKKINGNAMLKHWPFKIMQMQ